MSGPEQPSPVGWFKRPGYFTGPVPAFQHARVGDVMRPGLITCQPDTKLRGVAQAMAANHVHSVVVVDIGKDTNWRVVNAVDLVEMCGDGSADRTAADAATDPITVSVEEPVTRAAELMSANRTSHLLAIDADGSPVGMVSSLDLAAALAWGVGERQPEDA